MNQSQSASQLIVPNLPGYKPHDQKFGVKKKYFDKIGEFSIMKYEEPSDAFATTADGLEDQSVLSIGTSLKGRGKKFTPLEPENKSALSFQAYFEESSSVGKAVIRKCLITFFLEDNAMQIVEKPTKNSGIVGGAIMKRTVLTKPDGNPYSPYDFQLGAELIIYNRRYRLVDCDNFTRNYLISMEADPGQTIPRESYDDIRDDEKKSTFKREKNANSAYQAALLGVGVDNSGRAGFVTYGQKKLKFLCVWDNTEMLYGDALQFSMTYSLADDTVEIFSILGYNTGRDETFTRLLKKAKLPILIGTNILSGGDPVESQYYHWKDLYIGMNVPIYGRMLKIVDCDNETRDFYLNEGGIELGPSCLPRKIAPIEFKNDKEKEDKPDYSAIGVESAQPKKRNGDVRQLTFRAKLLSGGADDVDREFIITYYCQDDTIQILEPPIRNSGFWGGIFLARTRIRNSESEIVQDTDLWVGCDIRLLKHRFRLYEADAGTTKYMDLNSHKFWRADISCIMENKLRPVMRDDASSGVLTEKFAFHEKEAGTFDRDILNNILTSYGLYNAEDPGANKDQSLLCDHEVLTILHKTQLQNRDMIPYYADLINEIIEKSGNFA